MARIILSRKTTNLLVFILFVVIVASVFKISVPDTSLDPATLYHHATGHDKNEPDYWEWETTTRFAPIKNQFTASSSADDDHLCDSFPTYVLSRIQVVLKIGASEPADRVDAQISTVTRCIPNLLIVSDRESELKGHRVHDILATLPESFRFNVTDLEPYEALRRGDEKAVGSDEGWYLDRFKFLPMVERAHETNPTAQWYVFLESDTYYVWDNLFRLLDQYDPSEPLYFGSPSPGREISQGKPMYFAYGGAGFVLSGGAMKKMVHRHHGSMGEYVEPSLSLQYEDIVKGDCCGDSVLGWVLYQKGVKLSGLWPMFNPHPLHSIPFDNAYWCQPVISMHKTMLSDMKGLIEWENQRDRKKPLLYADLFEYTHMGTFASKPDWDNGDWGGFREPDESPAHISMEACRTACHEHAECLSYTYDHSGHCIFVRTMRLGHSKPPTKEVRLSAGWDVAKMRNWRASHQCEKPILLVQGNDQATINKYPTSTHQVGHQEYHPPTQHGVLKNAYDYILSFRPPPPPPEINITITTSSGVLHKYGAAEDEPFALTLEATLPEGSTNKPLTVFISNTLLNGGGRELLRGLKVINTATGISTNLDEWIIIACPRLAPHETPITHEYERKFINLKPGVPCRITNVVQRMSPLLLPSTLPLRTQAVIDRERDSFRPLDPKQWVEKLKDEMPSGSAEIEESESDLEFEDECEDKEQGILETARFDGLFAHTRYLEVGATYRVELRDTMHEILWYRYGTKEEILGSRDDGDASGRRKRPERIGDQKGLRAIALVLRNTATFTVVE